MQKVIDSNFLQCDALRVYLSDSSDNYAVLTEYAAMEAYKQDTLASIFARMEILVQFPRQVIVLKATQEVCELTGRAAASRTPLIDDLSTSGFPDFCQALLAAKRGDPFLQGQLLEHGREAAGIINKMLLDAPTLASEIDLMAKTYSPQELKILRRREDQTPRMFDKQCEMICTLADEFFFKVHPNVPPRPRSRQQRNTFVFRYAICSYVSILKRIRDGSAAKIKHEKLRNDVVDANFATFATYFDGFLTSDTRAGEIYAESEILLREMFAMPPLWLSWLLQRRWFQRLLSSVFGY